MRIRQVRREFWTDRRIALLSPRVRLFYIGLWCVADDDGYLTSDVAQIAGELFSFDGVKHRESVCRMDWQRLVEETRVVPLDCGRHATIPTLSEHQKLGGERIVTFHKEHDRECVGLQSPMDKSDRNGKERYVEGTVRGGTGGTAAPTEGSARGPRLQVVDGKWVAVPGKAS